MRARQFWPLPIVLLGTIFALFGLLYPSCNCLGIASCPCTSSPNYALNIGGLIVTIIFTYVFVFLSTSIQEAEQIVNNAR